ncbi:hypothetical protein PX699_24320 [Sphingobium sp. H39-3-25]|uniref:hypothetical protein n=1 Tax=Sphingobium TaxID=165695 RepID=UPI0023B9F019|nr:hypothetical protein [Sphingobium arseniciresistens]
MANYVTRAKHRAALRGWWGFVCAILMGTIGISAWIFLTLELLNWHDQLYHPERYKVFPRGPMELWSFFLIPTAAPCLIIATIMLNSVIWLFPPLRRLSEEPAKTDPSQSFGPVQRSLAKGAFWSSWTIPLAVMAARFAH